jgi:hypothetical protein
MLTSSLPVTDSSPLSLRDKITAFLDETVFLKYINLHADINFSSNEAFCFFVNIYHTLLVHARLILNPPTAKV